MACSPNIQDLQYDSGFDAGEFPALHLHTHASFAAQEKVHKSEHQFGLEDHQRISPERFEAQDMNAGGHG